MKSRTGEASEFETCKKVSSVSGGERPRAGPGPIETVDLRSLRLARRNARTHSKKQIRQIADSMLRFGVINPLIVDEQGRVVAGHGRFAAAELLGLRQLPVIRLSHLTDEEIRAYMLADNRLAEKAGWDRELLAIEFEELQIALPEIGLDLGITGFDPGEVELDHAGFQRRWSQLGRPDSRRGRRTTRGAKRRSLCPRFPPHSSGGCSRRRRLCDPDARRSRRDGIP